MLNFPVYFVDQDPSKTGLPDDEICYLVTKKGVYLKKKVGYIESVAPVDKISFLEEIQPDAKMDIKPIKAEDAAKVFTFFRSVYNIHRGEAVVLLFYNEQTGEYKIEAPSQKVSGGGCSYARGSVRVEGYDLIGTIHSHANFSAFHSGVDQGDEKSFDGLHITFGNVADDEFSISCSIVANGYRVITDPYQYIEGLKDTQKMTFAGSTYSTYDFKTKQMVKKTTEPKYELRYQIDLPKDKFVFNKSWLKKVEKQYSTVSYGKRSKWDWRKNKWTYDDFNDVHEALSKSPYNVGVSPNVKPLEFPKHDPKDFDDYNPCETCVFRNHKIEWAIEQYTDEIDDDFDEDWEEGIDYEVVGSHMESDDGSLMFEGEPVVLDGDGHYRHPKYGIVDPVELGLLSPEDLIEDQFNSDDYLTKESDNPIVPAVNDDEIPDILKDKPKNWIQRFWSRAKT